MRSAAFAQLAVERDDGVVQDCDVVVAHVGVERGVEHALLGHLSAQHDLGDLVLVQEVSQRRAVKTER